MSERLRLPPTPVEKWKTPDPVWVGPETPASDALALMTERGIRHLPVLDQHRRVVGVFSHNDLRAALPFARGLSTGALTSRLNSNSTTAFRRTNDFPMPTTSWCG